jgi:FkbM family methyltransferase
MKFNDNLTKTKQIIQVQGLSIFLRKFKQYYFTSDRNSDIKKAVLDNCSRYKIFIDIGANVGGITLALLKNFDCCIGFEPSEKPYKEFKKIIDKEKISNVTIFPIAIGEKKETKFFYESPIQGHNRFSVNENKTEKWKRVKVDVETLDNILAQLGINEKCLIKIDVEGYELHAMKGAKKTLEKDCTIVTEFNPYLLKLHNTGPYEYVEYMKSFGYSFLDMNGHKIKDQFLRKMCEFGVDKPHVADDFILRKLN